MKIPRFFGIKEKSYHFGTILGAFSTILGHFRPLGTILGPF